MPCSDDRYIYKLVIGISLVLGGFIFNTSLVQAATDRECLATWEFPEIQTNYVKAKSNLKRNKSGKQIEKIAKKSGYAKRRGHGGLLGLTHSSIGPSFAVSTKYIEVEKGRYCLKLRKVEFTFGIRKSEIYVDRKYRKSSCAYKVIYAHEKEHVRINEKTLDDYASKISKVLKKRAAAIKPFYTDNPKKAAQSIIDKLNSGMKPILKKFSDQREKANDVIDTNKAYAATQAKCSDW
ncbi:hypothetical protein NBZ79_01900 [Sneathiella marina]|uniref:DUF922 domain-containing protein n=1 Tax=Sneathiella marina TaxID=2950108 RepID=A0ABY4W4G7_9PROT|nr:hypothetical protein [Sneathiella marina]USG61726.1 hypothetical protein NBZ79_01900 [Sneathiella marina]